MYLIIKAISIITLALMSFQGHAEILERDSIAKVQDLIQDGDLVVFDIDNTLIQPEQTLGSDQWYDATVNEGRARGLGEDEAIDQAIAKWISIQRTTDVQLIEKGTGAFVRGLRAKGIRVLCLTARPKELSSVNIRQLASVGISLKSKWTEDLGFPESPAVILAGGIVSVGPRNNKGIIFRELVSKMSDVSRVVFFDDKLKHVQNMEAQMKEIGKPFIGVRYSATDAQVRNYNKDIAEVQMRYFSEFGALIPDSDVVLSK